MFDPISKPLHVCTTLALTISKCLVPNVDHVLVLKLEHVSCHFLQYSNTEPRSFDAASSVLCDLGNFRWIQSWISSIMQPELHSIVLCSVAKSFELQGKQLANPQKLLWKLLFESVKKRTKIQIWALFGDFSMKCSQIPVIGHQN